MRFENIAEHDGQEYKLNIYLNDWQNITLILLPHFVTLKE